MRPGFFSFVLQPEIINNHMKFILQILFLFAFGAAAQAQQNYFVYMQTDNKQPFYVKLNDKVMSSSGSGYVVIPKLSSGTHRLQVGFPKDQWPQQNIPITINKNDAGYLLKNFGEKGWGLYNIQTMAVTMNGSDGSQTGAPADGDDVFTNALAGAANTSLTMDKKPEVSPEAPKQEVTPIVVTREKEITAAVKPTGIQKLESVNDAAGTTLVYGDYTRKKADTIKIFIPAPSVGVVVNETPVISDVVVKETPAQERKFEDNDLNRQQNTIKETAAPAKGSSGDRPVVSFNSDCRETAGDDDFLKLRKKMASGSSDDDMVKTAGKFLKAKCYSAEQIKNLSLLFLNDAGKYKFFDAAYPRVYDTQNFASLQSQLSDEYFISRFRSMIRN